MLSIPIPRKLRYEEEKIPYREGEQLLWFDDQKEIIYEGNKQSEMAKGRAGSDQPAVRLKWGQLARRLYGNTTAMLLWHIILTSVVRSRLNIAPKKGTPMISEARPIHGLYVTHILFVLNTPRNQSVVRLVKSDSVYSDILDCLTTTSWVGRSRVIGSFPVHVNVRNLPLSKTSVKCYKTRTMIARYRNEDAFICQLASSGCRHGKLHFVLFMKQVSCECGYAI